MTLDSKESVVLYAQELIKSDLNIPYYNLKRLFELHDIEIEHIIFEESIEQNLTVIACSDFRPESDSVTLKISEKSWIEYLPSIYKENEALQNFLYGMQVSMFRQKEIVDNIEDIFIPRKSEFLDWLASWYGVSFSTAIESDTKRKLIYRLIELYKKRGTKEYLVEMVRILTGREIEIREREIPNYLKEEDSFMDGEYNLKIIFTVRLVDDFTDDKEAEKLLIKKIRNILNREKPAFTEYYIDSEVVQEEKKRGIDVRGSEEVHQPDIVGEEEPPIVNHFGYEKEEIEEVEKRVEIKSKPKPHVEDDDDFFDYDD